MSNTTDATLEAIQSTRPGLLEKIEMTIGEHLWGNTIATPDEGEDGALYIAATERLDAGNHVKTGSFGAAGVEYSFEAECVNWNGWVWWLVNADAPVPDTVIERTTQALHPNRELVNSAVASGRGPFLIMKWNALGSVDGLIRF